MLPIGKPGIDVQALSMRLIGGAVGGPVGLILGGLAAAKMPQAKDMVNNMCTMFEGATKPHAASAQRPQAFSMTVTIITGNPLQVATQPPAGNAQTHFAKAPMVGGPGDWAGFNKAVNDRITGSQGAKDAIGMQGDIWNNGKGDPAEKAAVGWAMQKDDRLRYDADRKQFYITNTDGSTKDVCSLDDMKGVINKNGGANPNNGAGFNAVGNYIDGLLKNETGAAQGANAAPAQQANANPLQQIMDLLQKLMQALMGQGMPGAGAPATNAAGGSESPAPAQSSESGLSRLNDRMERQARNMIDEGLALSKSPNPEVRQKGIQTLRKAAKLFHQLEVMKQQQDQMEARRGTEVRNNTRADIALA